MAGISSGSRRGSILTFLILASCSDDVAGPAEPIVASLKIVDAPATLLVADTVRLTLAAKDSGGAAVTPSVTWHVENGAVAAVNSRGLVSGRAEGTTTIRVTAGTFSDSISLTVTEGVRFASLVTGVNHACGLTSAGAVYCWGVNWGKQLGVEATTHTCPDFYGDQEPDCSPRPVRVAGSIQFATVSAGASHTCGLDGEGRAHCWGDNSWEQLGLQWDVTVGSFTPVQVSGTLTFQTLDAGGDFTCGLVQGGAAYCWGSHGFGELGTGDLELFTSAMPVAVVGGHQFTQLSTGWAHTCAWTASGVAYCWGENFSGALGIGSISPPGEWPAEPTPTAVVGGLTFTQVGAGGGWSCALGAAGVAYCWGASAGGQLGNGSTTNNPSPQPVAGGLTWRSLTVGMGHTCGFTTAGEVACWGNNFSGQLGVAPTGEMCPGADNQPPFACSTKPVVRPATPRRFKSVIAGGGFTCALDELGYAFCWGQNQFAELGNGQVGGGSHVPSPVISPE